MIGLYELLVNPTTKLTEPPGPYYIQRKNVYRDNVTTSIDLSKTSMAVDIHRKIHQFTCGASCRYGRSVSNKKKVSLLAVPLYLISLTV